MHKDEIWTTIHTERRALADDLAALGDEQWDTTSLCTEWTVRDVVAHMTATAKVTPARFFPKLAGSGFSFNKMQSKDIQAERGSSPRDTLDRFRAVIDRTDRPPGPIDTALGETIVHAEDVRRAVGVAHEYPKPALREVAGFYAGSNLIIGTKKRIQGLALRATDDQWRHGEGSEVSGPMLSLLLAMSGRKAALGDLTGDGVQVLQARG